MRYEEFVVQLGPETNDGVEVRASCSLAGEARSHFALSLSPSELVSDFSIAVLEGQVSVGSFAGRNLQQRVSHPPSMPVARSAFELGAALFDALFRGPVRSLLDHSLGSLEEDGIRGLRFELKLELTDARLHSLHSLPWELMYKPDTGDFLALGRRTSIVRYLELPRKVQRTVPSDLLRVLALAPETPGLPALDLQSERQDLESLKSELQGLDVTFLKSASLGALRETLVDEEFHVLHLMCHADFDPSTGDGVVYLEHTDGGIGEVRAENLVAVVKDSPSLRLIVLNACNTARSGGLGGTNPFSGLASALMRAGLPAVLAMQLPVSDEAAVAFSRAFYARLGSGHPVDSAVTEGRQAIHARAPRSMEWAVPALFLRATDGRIFGPRKEPVSLDPKVEISGLDRLRAGDFEGSIHHFRAAIATEPEQGLHRVALGVALSRGRSLRQLPYQTAKEMHRLFTSAASTPDGRNSAVVALLALKVEYFEANSVREPQPTEDLVEPLDQLQLTRDEVWLLSCLRLSKGNNEMLVNANLARRRKS